MGKYATSTSLSLLMPNWLSGNTTSSDAEGTNLWSLTVDRVEALVDAKIAKKYDLTSFSGSSTPPLIRKLVEDIATYETLRRSSVQDAQMKIEALAEWERAMKTLDEIADCTLQLANTAGALIPVLTTRMLSAHTGYTPIFGLDDPVEWKRDDDEVQDQIDARQ